MAKVIFARSPFIVEVNVPNQTSTRLVLEIRNANDTLLNSYSFSKNIASAINKATYYNVSNFILEYLETINPDYATPTENTNLYLKVAIQKYYTISPNAEVAMAVENYLAVNGFTEYTNGMNSYLEVDALPMTSDLELYSNKTIYSNKEVTQVITPYSAFVDQTYTVDNTIIKVDSTLIKITSVNPNLTVNKGSYVDVLFQKIDGANYSVKYTYNGTSNSLDITPTDTSPIIKKMFLQSPYSDYSYPYTIGLYRNNELLWSRVIYIDEECKYTPSFCSFISKSGGWENVYFMKAKEDSSTMQNTAYNLLQDYNYNYLKGQKKAFNTNGNDSIKCNTGWVDESMNIILKDLMFSETILLDSKPVLIKNKSMTFKNTLKTKMINYEIEFEYAYNYINNVV